MATKRQKAGIRRQAGPPVTKPARATAKKAAEEGGNSLISAERRAKYAEHGGSCGDAFAEAFSEAMDGADTTVALIGIGKDNGIDVEERYGHLNAGGQRMSVGNVLRGKVYAGETVTIGKTVFDLGGAVARAKKKQKAETVGDLDVQGLLASVGLADNDRGHRAVERIFKAA